MVFPTLPEADSYHLYVSANNAGATEIAEELRGVQKASVLKTTTNFADLRRCRSS